MHAKLKVMHVIHWPKSGIVNLVKQMAPIMTKDGVESHVIFFHHDPNTLNDFKQVCQHAGSLNFTIPSAGSISRFRLAIAQSNPHILHSHSFQPMLWGEWLRPRSTRHLTTIHNDYPHLNGSGLRDRVKRMLLKHVLLNGVNTVGVSTQISRKLLSLGVPREHLQTVGNGVQTAGKGRDLEARERIRNSLGLADRDLLLLSVGRLHEQKAFDLFLLAFREVRNRNRRVRAVLVGDGPERLRLEKLAADLGIGQSFQFAGFQSDPFPFLSAADLYVCSSAYEGSPLSIAEAMICGLPVVSTAVGGVPDMVEDGRTGILVPPGKAGALAEAMFKLIDDREGRLRMGMDGYAAAIAKLDIRTTAQNYIELYRYLIGDIDHA